MFSCIDGLGVRREHGIGAERQRGGEHLHRTVAQVRVLRFECEVRRFELAEFEIFPRVQDDVHDRLSRMG